MHFQEFILLKGGLLIFACPAELHQPSHATNKTGFIVGSSEERSKAVCVWEMGKP